MNPFEQVVTIPPGLLEPDAMARELTEMAADLGYQNRLFLRDICRRCGVETLPASVVYFNGHRYDLPAEDLAVLLPGEVA